MKIDRFEGGYAVCECGGEIVNIPASELPEGAREGSILILVKDEAAEQADRARIAEKQRALFE